MQISEIAVFSGEFFKEFGTLGTLQMSQATISSWVEALLRYDKKNVLIN